MPTEKARFEILLEDIRSTVRTIAEGHQLLDQKIDRNTVNLQRQINEMKEDMQLGFRQVVREFGNVHKKFDEVEARLNVKIEGVEVKLSSRIDAVEGRLDAKIDGVEQSLSSRIDGVEAKLSSRIDAGEARLDAKIDKVGANLIEKLELHEKLHHRN